MSVSRILRRTALTALCFCTLVGCDEPDALGLDDLTVEETLFVTRFIQLERARAVALVDRDAGFFLLDSLGVAWDDTSLARARAAIPEDADRQARLFRLLEGLLLAERDSLLDAPRPDRLSAPLPEPALRATVEPATPESQDD